MFSNSMRPDERDLLRSASTGDRDAFAILYKAHLSNLYRYIYLICKSKEISDDIAQNVFVKIWENREALVHVISFKSYLYRLAKNALFDYLRRSRLEVKVAEILRPVSEESPITADSKAIYNEYSKIIKDAIELLPPKRKEIVELRTQQDLSLDEIALKLGISKPVVKKQLYSGLDFIRKYIQKYGELSTAFLIYIYNQS